LSCLKPTYSTKSSFDIQVYTNPISNLVVGVKLFSLASSGLVLAAQPFLFSKFTTMASFAPFLISSLSFAFLTPILLHVLTRSCVFRINYNPQTGRFMAYTKTIFLRSKKVEFSLEDVSYSVASLCFANMTVNKKTPLLVLESGFIDLEMKNQLFGYMIRLACIFVPSRASSTTGVSVYVKTKARASGHTLCPFIDVKQVVVHAGKGGDGCIAFDRYFCNPYGGPSGGDGGNGGHVIFQADSGVIDLSDVDSVLRASDGSKGSGGNRHGSNGKNLVVKVPLDTQVHLLASKEDSTVSAHRADTSSLLWTLVAPSETLVAARGGAGGRGNAFFASANKNRSVEALPRIGEAALRFAERGAMGQSRRLLLRLAKFTDVGLVGGPNAGKSTLLRRLTRARPRVAPHPFTTLRPHVGTLEIPHRNNAKGNDDGVKLLIADLPGLIEGAAECNAGLGAQFLSLIEGCRLLVYLVDVGTFFTSGSRAFSLAEATAHFASHLRVLYHELKLFNPRLVDDTGMTSLVVGTKIDLVVPPSSGHETLLKLSICLCDAARQTGLLVPRVLLISARRGDNVEQLVELLGNMQLNDK
uniref:OBG-type G domain-containing protein n=1 Tax=Taenia asiatica TaxID=60517 RepID=A0A0R3WFH0_TAEAS